MRRAPDAPIRGRGVSLANYVNTKTISSFLVAAVNSAAFWILCIAAVLLWIVSIYGHGLRDPRYFDGWVLAVGMGVQLYFHIAIKTAILSPKSAKRWRSIHIFLGYLLIAAFISHSDFSLPDSSFEWVLWVGFVVVTISGIFGAYIAWSLRTKRGIDEQINYDRIPTRRVELARQVQTAIAKTDPTAAAIALPGLPYDAWIMELYAKHLRHFFQGQRNYAAHLIASRRPLKRLTDEIDHLSPYVDQQSQEKLAAIKDLVIEKDRLDFARVYLGLNKAWLFVHVPVTYALIVMTVLHVVIVYAFSSGAW